MKLWHDDIRRPPDDTWLWVRNNTAARSVLSAFIDQITEISLDHDMGLDHLDPDMPNAVYMKGSGEDDGLRLVDWMIANDCVPPKVTIHSMNPSGADRMRKTLINKGHHCVYIPFTLPGTYLVDR